MARPCPTCARPNADTAVKCLYCSAPLQATGAEPVPVEDMAVMPEAEMAPFESDRYLVILFPAGVPDDGMVTTLSEISGLSRYDARISLHAKRPRLFRRVEGELMAQFYSDRLSAARIPHYVVSEASVRSLPVSRARRIELKTRHLEAALEGVSLSIPYADLLILVRGEIARESHNEKRMATTRGASRALSPGLRLHLYSGDASVAMEVDPENFGWPDLGGELSQSALLNLERFLDILEEVAPGAVLDRGFDLELPVLSRSGAGNDLSQMLSSGGRGSGAGVLHDNEEQFRFYSRWRYRLERHFVRADR